VRLGVHTGHVMGLTDDAMCGKCGREEGILLLPAIPMSNSGEAENRHLWLCMVRAHIQQTNVNQNGSGSSITVMTLYKILVRPRVHNGPRSV
jgi:hypothetical protein